MRPVLNVTSVSPNGSGFEDSDYSSCELTPRSNAEYESFSMHSPLYKLGILGVSAPEIILFDPQKNKTMRETISSFFPSQNKLVSSCTSEESAQPYVQLSSCGDLRFFPIELKKPCYMNVFLCSAHHSHHRTDALEQAKKWLDLVKAQRQYYFDSILRDTVFCVDGSEGVSGNRAGLDSNVLTRAADLSDVPVCNCIILLYHPLLVDGGMAAGQRRSSDRHSKKPSYFRSLWKSGKKSSGSSEQREESTPRATTKKSQSESSQAQSVPNSARRRSSNVSKVAAATQRLHEFYDYLSRQEFRGCVFIYDEKKTKNLIEGFLSKSCAAFDQALCRFVYSPARTMREVSGNIRLYVECAENALRFELYDEASAHFYSVFNQFQRHPEIFLYYSMGTPSGSELHTAVSQLEVALVRLLSNRSDILGPDSLPAMSAYRAGHSVDRLFINQESVCETFINIIGAELYLYWLCEEHLRVLRRAICLLAILYQCFSAGSAQVETRSEIIPILFVFKVGISLLSACRRALAEDAPAGAPLLYLLGPQSWTNSEYGRNNGSPKVETLMAFNSGATSSIMTGSSLSSVSESVKDALKSSPVPKIKREGGNLMDAAEPFPVPAEDRLLETPPIKIEDLPREAKEPGVSSRLSKKNSARPTSCAHRNERRIEAAAGIAGLFLQVAALWGELGVRAWGYSVPRLDSSLLFGQSVNYDKGEVKRPFSNLELEALKCVLGEKNMLISYTAFINRYLFFLSKAGDAHTCAGALTAAAAVQLDIATIYALGKNDPARALEILENGSLYLLERMHSPGLRIAISALWIKCLKLLDITSDTPLNHGNTQRVARSLKRHLRIIKGISTIRRSKMEYRSNNEEKEQQKLVIDSLFDTIQFLESSGSALDLQGTQFWETREIAEFFETIDVSSVNIDQKAESYIKREQSSGFLAASIGDTVLIQLRLGVGADLSGLFPSGKKKPPFPVTAELNFINDYLDESIPPITLCLSVPKSCSFILKESLSDEDVEVAGDSRGLLVFTFEASILFCGTFLLSGLRIIFGRHTLCLKHTFIPSKDCSLLVNNEKEDARQFMDASNDDIVLFSDGYFLGDTQCPLQLQIVSKGGWINMTFSSLNPPKEILIDDRKGLAGAFPVEIELRDPLNYKQRKTTLSCSKFTAISGVGELTPKCPVELYNEFKEYSVPDEKNENIIAHLLFYTEKSCAGYKELAESSQLNSVTSPLGSLQLHDCDSKVIHRLEGSVLISNCWKALPEDFLTFSEAPFSSMPGTICATIRCRTISSQSDQDSPEEELENSFKAMEKSLYDALLSGPIKINILMYPTSSQNCINLDSSTFMKVSVVQHAEYDKLVLLYEEDQVCVPTRISVEVSHSLYVSFIKPAVYVSVKVQNKHPTLSINITDIALEIFQKNAEKVNVMMLGSIKPPQLLSVGCDINFLFEIFPTESTLSCFICTQYVIVGDDASSYTCTLKTSRAELNIPPVFFSSISVLVNALPSRDPADHPYEGTFDSTDTAENVLKCKPDESDKLLLDSAVMLCIRVSEKEGSLHDAFHRATFEVCDISGEWDVLGTAQVVVEELTAALNKNNFFVYFSVIPRRLGWIPLPKCVVKDAESGHVLGEGGTETLVFIY